MKLRIGAYLSKRTAARLTTAARRRGLTKSALIEAALNQFLEADDDGAVTLSDQIASLSDQIGQLDRDLGIVGEIVALHARFHLTIAPELPAATQPRACRRGSARFDEFATQVERRIQRGTSLMQETMDRLTPTRASATSADGPKDGGLLPAAVHESDFAATSRLDAMLGNTAAVREDGSTGNFPVQPRSPLH